MTVTCYDNDDDRQQQSVTSGERLKRRSMTREEGGQFWWLEHRRVPEGAPPTRSVLPFYCLQDIVAHCLLIYALPLALGCQEIEQSIWQCSGNNRWSCKGMSPRRPQLIYKDFNFGGFRLGVVDMVGVLCDELLEVGGGSRDVEEARWVGRGFDLCGDEFIRGVGAGEESRGGGESDGSDGPFSRILSSIVCYTTTVAHQGSMPLAAVISGSLSAVSLLSVCRHAGLDLSFSLVGHLWLLLSSIRFTRS
ncbi:hypothetical protein Ddye_018115 [Dipteronia dyeriana]|uniref:Uncharacterized protein n=1 Tax=Dipteronia dyeriana TaxID=168575 RepID=A0AAD9X158_9ROSI|nr:hypothetical protein Ddye_018115 [Dipteronia dyeriana]